MRKGVKARNIALAVLAGCLITAGSASALTANQTAQAATEPVYGVTMAEGASIRYLTNEKDSGLRFDLSMTAETYNQIKVADKDEWTVDVGMLLVPEKLLNGAELNLETAKTNTYIQKISIEPSEWLPDDAAEPASYKTWVAVYNYPQEYYNLDIAAVGYVNNGTAAYYTTGVVRSMTQVAYDLEQKGLVPDDKQELNKNYYEEINFTVDFDVDGGQSVNSQSVLVGGKATAVNTEKTGYDFVKWYDEDDSNKTAWNFETSTVTKNLTLKAEWQAKPYTLTFDKNDGSDVTTAQGTYGELVNKPEDPVVAGWTFDGWYNGTDKWNFATDAVKGAMTLEAKYVQNVTVTDTFEVYQDNAGVLDSGWNGVLANQLATNEFSVAVNNIPTTQTVTAKAGENVITDYTWNENVLKVNGKSFGSKVYGDVKVILTDGDYTANVSVQVVTKYLSTNVDYYNIKFYGGIETKQEENVTQYTSYDGYFVMKNDISCGYSGAAYPNWWASQLMTNRTDDNGIYGFQGIFDGQGYSITEVYVAGYDYMLFTNVAKCAVIKNLGIKTTTYNVSNGSENLLAYNFSGTLQNVYIDVQIGQVNIAGSQLNLLANNMAYSQLKDVVIKYDASKVIEKNVAPIFAQQIAIFSGWDWPHKMTCENVHVFTQSEITHTYGETTESGEIVGVTGVTRYAYDGTATGVTMTDATYWDLSGNQPAWKGKTA